MNLIPLIPAHASPSLARLEDQMPHRGLWYTCTIHQVNHMQYAQSHVAKSSIPSA
jgi:hypothetical protein